MYLNVAGAICCSSISNRDTFWRGFVSPDATEIILTHWSDWNLFVFSVCPNRDCTGKGLWWWIPCQSKLDFESFFWSEYFRTIGSLLTTLKDIGVACYQLKVECISSEDGKKIGFICSIALISFHCAAFGACRSCFISIRGGGGGGWWHWWHSTQQILKENWINVIFKDQILSSYCNSWLK